MSELAVQERVPSILLEGVSHQYGSRAALYDLTLRIEQGDFVSILGPNGSGKTTLFRILSTLLRPSQGRALVLGHATSTEPETVRRLLGVVFQSPALDADLSIRENLLHHGALYGLHGRSLNQRISELLETFDLADRAHERVRTLSGGLARRADLIRGLLHAPRVLLLDEPTVGLDPAARHGFWQSLSDLRRKHETTVLVATHLTDEADDSDQAVILHDGRLVAAGTPEHLRGEIGTEALWIESDDAPALSRDVTARFRVETHVIGSSVLVRTDNSHALVGPLYDAFQEHILEIAVRRPTLEDVLLYHTGSRLQREEVPAEA